MKQGPALKWLEPTTAMSSMRGDAKATLLGQQWSPSLAASSWLGPPYRGVCAIPGWPIVQVAFRVGDWANSLESQLVHSRAEFFAERVAAAMDVGLYFAERDV